MKSDRALSRAARECHAVGRKRHGDSGPRVAVDEGFQFLPRRDVPDGDLALALFVFLRLGTTADREQYAIGRKGNVPEVIGFHFERRDQLAGLSVS